MKAHWVIGGALALAAAASADEAMRCAGGAIVNVGMIADQVLAKCGEPKSRQVEEVPIRQRTRSGGVNTTGVTYIERWTYDRGYGQFPALLTFEEGKLKAIEIQARH
jgi:hypothetical protein